MSDYTDKEQSVQDGAPYELYEWIGSYTNYYMTSDSIPHTYNGRIYLPVAGLKRSTIKAPSYDEDSTDVTITMPMTAQLVKDYGFQSTPPDLQLNLYRFQRGATTSVVYWTGPVSGISIDNELGTITVPAMFGNVLRGDLPSVYIQPPCNNILFDARCKINRAANAVSTTVLAVNGLVITVASAGGFPAGWFIGGEVVMTDHNERRMILAQSGVGASAQFTVNYAFANLKPGMSIEIASGCDHSYTSVNGCPKYSNEKNFGGMPFVPGESNDPHVYGVK